MRNKLFLANSSISYWRFEVVYSVLTEISFSGIEFHHQSTATKRFCSITPSNGTTSTLFTISCSSWQDPQGILDYSFYSMFHFLCLTLILAIGIIGWTTDRTDRVILAFSSSPTLQLRLPAGTDNHSKVHVIGFIRDTLFCATEFNLTSVVVVLDSEKITNFVDSLQNSTSGLTKNILTQILASGNQNAISQLINSLSEEFNQINDQTVENAVASEIKSI